MKRVVFVKKISLKSLNKLIELGYDHLYEGVNVEGKHCMVPIEVYKAYKVHLINRAIETEILSS
ncbi:MAG: hypothetical protein HWN81_00290 [Candidatus Lokiarchaeota archaeon]|nr:hypothetical protein [Candidatus Lokiarchaeota archaeon]